MHRRLRQALGPLGRASTYRRGVFLLLGAVVLLPYILVGVAFVQMLSGDVPRVPVVVLLALTGAIAVIPAFLRPTRALEIHAVRGLLEVDLPDPPLLPTTARRSLEAAWTGWQTRVATATWYACHLLAGGALAVVLFTALPVTVVYVLVRLGLAPETLVEASEVGFLAGVGAGWLAGLSVLCCVGVVYLVAGLGAGLARLAPVLLGPSAAERVASLEAAATVLAERNRLARDLHDSVGHALTVTTLQAAAARTVLDRDPEFARRALVAIEDAGRSAMADLDHVLGLLRAADDDAPRRVAPQPTLSDLDRLAADSRAAGHDVRLDVRIDAEATGAGGIDAVPPAVSREGYRILQEALTNALRHGAGGPTSVRVAVTRENLELDVRNGVSAASAEVPAVADGSVTPASPRRPGASGGRGLAGMRERVRLLHGSMRADRDGDEWAVAVRLPHGAAAEDGS